MTEFPTWDDIVNQENLTAKDRIILTCIANLSIQDEYADKTPWEVYDLMIKQAKEIAEGEMV